MRARASASSLVVAAAVACAASLPAPASPLTLEEAVRLAGTSESLRLKALGLRKASSKLNEAQSQAWPKLTMELSASALANPPEGITVSKGELGSITIPGPVPTTLLLPSSDIVFVPDAEPTYYQLGATLTQPLVTWGKIANAIKLAELDRASASVELARQGRQVRRDVRKAYFSAMLADRSFAILGQMRDGCAQIVDDRRKSFGEGDVARQAVLEAEASLASIEAKLAEASEARSSAFESLAMLTGVGPGGVELSTPFRDKLPDIDEEALRSQALGASEDLKLARNRAQAARVAVDLARGGASPKPDLALSVSFNLTGQRTPFSSETWSDSWDWNVVVSVGAKANVFDAGASGSKLSQAEADLEAAGVGIEQAEKLLRLAVRKSVDRARTAAAALAEKEAKLALAAEVSRNAGVSFDNGLVTRADLRSAELAALSAQLDRELALFTLEDSLDELEYLSGGAQ